MRIFLITLNILALTASLIWFILNGEWLPLVLLLTLMGILIAQLPEIYRSRIVQTLTSIDFLKIVFPLIIAISVWHLNNSSQLKWEQYKKKEENYRELVKAAEGFYGINPNNFQQRQQFIEQINLSWLYASDEVIHNINEFLDTQMEGNEQKYSPEERKRLLGKIMLSVRKDLISNKTIEKTDLKESDFQLLIPLTRQ